MPKGPPTGAEQVPALLLERSQEAHVAIGHAIAERVDAALFRETRTR